MGKTIKKVANFAESASKIRSERDRKWLKKAWKKAQKNKYKDLTEQQRDFEHSCSYM